MQLIRDILEGGPVSTVMYIVVSSSLPVATTGEVKFPPPCVGMIKGGAVIKLTWPPALVPCCIGVKLEKLKSSIFSYYYFILILWIIGCLFVLKVSILVGVS